MLPSPNLEICPIENCDDDHRHDGTGRYLQFLIHGYTIPLLRMASRTANSSNRMTRAFIF